MIFTSIEHLILEDLPSNLYDALGFIIYNKDMLNNLDLALNQSLSFQVSYPPSSSDTDIAYWRSHRKYIHIYVLLEGSEIIDFNYISNLSVHKNYHSKSDTILYTGVTANRLRQETNDIVVFFPEEAYRMHYITQLPARQLLIRVPIA